MYYPATLAEGLQIWIEAVGHKGSSWLLMVFKLMLHNLIKMHCFTSRKLFTEMFAIQCVVNGKESELINEY